MSIMNGLRFIRTSSMDTGVSKLLRRHFKLMESLTSKQK